MRNIHDIHVHMRIWDEAVVRSFFDTVADSGVTKLALQALPYRSPINNLVMLYWKARCERIVCATFGSVQRFNPLEDEPYETQAERLFDMGCDGIKIIEMCPSVRKKLDHGIDDPSWDAMFSLLEKRGKPVLIHVADPEEYWDDQSERIKREPDNFLDESYLTKKQHYDEAFRMLDKHPQLKQCH